jgi:hypothetical protein
MSRAFGVRLAAVVMLAATGCDSAVVCGAGQVSYQGRPPASLFAFDTTCREGCFSMPSDASCEQECPDVTLKAPTGVLLSDRSLWLADIESLGSGRALIFSFGYVDEAGGTAPAGWGLTAAGPRSYLSDQIAGSARFVMEATAVTYEVSGELLVVTDVLGGPLPVDPGRLDVRRVEAGRIAGEFFLGFVTVTNQPQGQVNGCFDLSMGPEQEAGGVRFRRLNP